MAAAVAIVALVTRTGREPAANASAEPVEIDFERLDPAVRDHVQRQLRSVAEDPADTERHATLGIALIANSLWAEALPAFETVARLDDGNPLGHLYVGIVAAELGDEERAVRQFELVTRRFPRFAPAHDWLAGALLDRDDLDGAEEAFARYAQLAPSDGRGLTGLGTVSVRRGDFARAAEYLEQAIAASPTAKPARHQLGLAYRGLERFDEAERELRMGRDAKNKHVPDPWSARIPAHRRIPKHQFHLSMALRAQGKADVAVRMLERALEWHPGNLDIMSHLALAHRDAGESERGLEILRKVLEADGTRYRDEVNLAGCLLSLGRLDEALRHVDRAVELAPVLAATHLSRGTLLLALGRPDDALVTLERARTLEPFNAEVLTALGETLLGLGRPEEARRHLDAAVREAPGSVRAHVGRIEALLVLRAWDEATRALADARWIAPGDPRLAPLQRRVDEGPRR